MEHASKNGEVIITRRHFIKDTTAGSLGLALGLSANEVFSAETMFIAKKPQSRLVLIRRENAVNKEGEINAKVVKAMLDEALKTFAKTKSVKKAWKKYIKPKDTVGVKMSRCSWMRIPTEQAVIDAIEGSLKAVNIPENQINTADGGLPVDNCTALINVSSVKVHTNTGIAASIKNYINFTDKESSYHNEGNAKLGEIWNLPNVKGKTRLIIVDFLKPYFGPGPQINPLHRWYYNGILVGTDPVAIDTVCLAICRKKRDLFKKEPWPVSPPALHIQEGEKKYKLGTSNPDKIQLTRLGWKKEILI
jgi:hypothetical protein